MTTSCLLVHLERNFFLFLLTVFIGSSTPSYGALDSLHAMQKTEPPNNRRIEVGVARIDITPEGPIRLAGYGGRASESEGVLQPLWAKALAFGSDEQGPSLFVTVDLIGIPGHITEKVARRLSEKTAITPSQLVISSSHTHTGPEVGNLLNHFGKPMPPEELGRIVRYQDELTDKLEQVALQALQNRSPALAAWGQGEVGFAVNRRKLENGRWVGFGVVPEGPVDHSMPLLRVTDPDSGTLRAVLVNYACHGTTLGGDTNKIHGDWIGEAQRIIEKRHPGATALVSVGAGGDANPEPRTGLEYTTRHGKEIADEVDRLLNSSLQPLTTHPVGELRKVDLPFSNRPTTQELVEQTSANGSEGYYAHLALDRIARGEPVPTSLSYPIQTWTFGDELAMIFLAGEVVVDYSLRFKEELESDHVWVTAYANDVPSYIPSRRVIQEGGYEAEYSQYSYDRPSPYVEDIEDLIVGTVYHMLPDPWKPRGWYAEKNPDVVRPDNDGNIYLNAEMGEGIGPDIEYMPEWKAFGWFTQADRVEWEVASEKQGNYEVHLEWSVSDEEAGKSFALQVGDQQVTGKVGRTGSWETFKTTKIGQIQLSGGRQKVIFKPNSRFEEGALLDLKELRLIPVD